MKAKSPEADPDCDDNRIQRRARIALAAVCEPGEAGLANLIDMTSPTATVASLLAGRRTLVRVPRAEAIGRRLAALDLAALIDRGEEIGARVVLPGDPQWPGRLADLGAHRPLAVWCWGEANPRLHTVRSVAIVGARACTRYGEWVARDWAAQLASEQLSVISGGAYGIDAAAHRGALAVEGVTICVVAGGVDMAYPRGHEGLFAEIVERGVILSEAPLGETVRRRRFLTRNRLIAALANATCVVEAARRSGSARTASSAAEMNRPVLAVPGPVTSETSQGTHRLIHDGIATLAADVNDVRTAIDGMFVSPDPADGPDAVSASMREVLDVLPSSQTSSAGLRLEDVAVRSGALAPIALEQLECAERMGLVERRGTDGWVFRATLQRDGRV